MRVGPYQAWLFDCDGVLLDSNSVKTDAFYQLARPFGVDIADALVAYHRETGGVSRFVKVRYLYETLLGGTVSEEMLREGLARFGELVTRGLEACALAPGVVELLGRLPAGVYRAVISGGLETEVRATLSSRGLAAGFDAIRGSPATKDEIFSELTSQGALQGGAVYFGDSRYDCEVAERFGVDMVFVSGMSEFEGWQAFFEDRRASIVESLADVSPI